MGTETPMNDVREPVIEQVMLRLPAGVHARLRVQAQRKSIPMATMARLLVVDGLERLERLEGD